MQNVKNFSLSSKDYTCSFVQPLVQGSESSNTLALANQWAQEEGKNEWVRPSAEDTGVVSFWMSLVSEQVLQLGKLPEGNDRVS